MDESFRVGDDLAIQMKQEAKKNNHAYADGGVMQVCGRAYAVHVYVSMREDACALAWRAGGRARV